jgi:DNA mismatch endonuclease Vsr
MTKGKYIRTASTRKKLSDFAKTRTGEKNSFYGKHHTEKSKQLDREKHLGKPTVSFWLGKKFSQATKDKLSEAKKGKPHPWQKGKTYEQISGIEKGKKHRENHTWPGWNKGLTKETDIRLKKQSDRLKGIPKSKDTKLKLSISHSTPQAIARSQELRLKQVFPLIDTSIEKKIQEQLRTAKIAFETYKEILGQPDIYISEKNLAIFADGCYWHACHECKVVPDKSTKTNNRVRRQFYNDFAVKRELELEGHNVIRLWEHDINRQDFNITEYINKVV